MEYKRKTKTLLVLLLLGGGEIKLLAFCRPDLIISSIIEVFYRGFANTVKIIAVNR